VFLGVIGTALILAGLWLGRDAYTLASDGVRAHGTVVKNSSQRIRGHSRDTPSDAKQYFPVISVTTEDNQSFQFTSRLGATPAQYSVGDRVVVRYLADDSNTAEIDVGWVQWLVPGLLGLFGVVASWVAFLLLTGKVRLSRR